MARDSSGPKNEPQYSSSSASSQAADLTEVAAYAAKVGNRKADTRANRLAASGADVWVGLMWHETDTDLDYFYSAGNAWVLLSMPGCDLACNIASVATGTAVTLGSTPNAYTEISDKLNWHDPSTNPNRITPTIAGVYLVTMGANWATNAGTTGTRQYIIRKNGTVIPGGGPVVAAATDISGNGSSSIPVQLNGTTDYIDVGIIHSAGQGIAFASTLTVQLLRAS